MNLEALPNSAAVAERAADIVEETLQANPEAILLLPAGNTPVPTFEELRLRVECGRLDISRAHLVQLDEIAGVAPEDGRSFNAFLRAHLLSRVPRDAERNHLLDGLGTEVEIARHWKQLEELGCIDLALVGIGGNGHVAFNEPGSRPADGARVVQLAENTRKALASKFAPEAAPVRGLTLGLGEIASARRILMLATGDGKAAIVAALLAGAAGAELPAAFLTDHPGFLLLADEAALRLP